MRNFLLTVTALLLAAGQLCAQKKSQTYEGKVVDSLSGSALPAVSVTISGTGLGATTDETGQFVLNANPGDELLIERVGYKAASRRLDETADLGTIRLEIGTVSLEDVVVVGYGTSKKKDLTGSVASLKVENSPLVLLPNANSFDLIKGRMPGVNIGATNNAGGNPGFDIRGQNSLRASNSPLIVLDGVIYTGSTNEINPNDIATIDVLKDASAAAVYGSRAANGVILITTKRGRSGKPKINARVTGGIQTYTNKPPMRGPEGFIQLKYDVRRLNGASPADLELEKLLEPKEYQAYQEGHTIDWFDDVTRVAPFKDYQLNVSGGSDRFNYYISGDYLDQQGIMYNDQFKKFTVFSKVEAKITDWLTFGLNLGVINKNADGVAADLRLATLDGPYAYKYVQFDGYTDIYERFPQTTTTLSSPYWRTLVNNQDRNQNYRSLTTVKVDVPWVEGLSYQFKYSLNRWEGHANQMDNEFTFINTLNLADLQNPSRYLSNATGYRNNNERTDWYLNHLITYDHEFGDHSFNVTLLAERQKVINSFMFMRANDFSQAGTTVLGWNALELGDAARRSISTSASELMQLAYLARLNYVYKGRYHLTGSVRRDGYSGFADGNKYGTFSSLGVAWTATNEAFLNNSRIVKYLKLRASYGENGNPSVGSYGTFASVGTNNYLFGTTTVNTIYPSSLGNKQLTWEYTQALNFGADFTLFDGLLDGTVDYYRSKTKNLLISRRLPITSGFGSVLDNAGQIDNWGIETSLTANIIRKGDFRWSVGSNFWLNRNKIVSLYGLDGNKDGIEDDDVNNRLFIGKSLGAIYDYTFDGIDPQTGNVMFKDLNENGQIDAGDRSILGYSKPNYTITFFNTLSYKQFELYFLVNAITAGGKENWYLASNQFAYNPGTLAPGLANWLDKEYWTPEKPSATIPRPNYVNTYQYGFWQPHAFVRLQDLSLSYRFDNGLLSKTFVRNARVFLAGKNLLTFTNWEGMDPETGAQYAGTNDFPVFKTITLGIEIGL